jgi:hypothetical protein
MPETTSGEARTAISCPKALLDRWRESLPGEPPALASQWHQQYPAIFDADDLALVVNQSGYHFYEWYTAIRLFQRDGSRSLVEKYDTYENNGLNHLRKKPRAARSLSTRGSYLRSRGRYCTRSARSVECSFPTCWSCPLLDRPSVSRR